MYTSFPIVLSALQALGWSGQSGQLSNGVWRSALQLHCWLCTWLQCTFCCGFRKRIGPIMYTCHLLQFSSISSNRRLVSSASNGFVVLCREDNMSLRLPSSSCAGAETALTSLSLSLPKRPCIHWYYKHWTDLSNPQRTIGRFGRLVTFPRYPDIITYFRTIPIETFYGAFRSEGRPAVHVTPTTANQGHRNSITAAQGVSFR